MKTCPMKKTTSESCQWLEDSICFYPYGRAGICPNVANSTGCKDKKTLLPSNDKVSDEISNILEQIGDVQAELICRHQFGNSVRPSLENVSEEDLCERGIRLFYMLRNKYQGKDATLRENKAD